MKKLLYAFITMFLCVNNVLAKDKAVEPNYIYDEILDKANYEIIDYNYPAGTRELNLFGLKTVRQFNLNVVASPDFEYLVYSEVYFYPDPRVTASALYLIPVTSGMSKKEAFLSASTKSKLQQPIIETDYANLYPFQFDTYTIVDWNKTSNKILFKQKLGQNYKSIYLTKIYVYDLAIEQLYDLNIVRQEIIDYWANKDVFLENAKWDIVPLGFLANNENQVLVNAYGYYKNEKKFLGTWTVDVMGKKAYLYNRYADAKIPVSSNGKYLKFIPDMEDVYAKQREIDRKNYEIYIEPK